MNSDRTRYSSKSVSSLVRRVPKKMRWGPGANEQETGTNKTSWNAQHNPTMPPRRTQFFAGRCWGSLDRPDAETLVPSPRAFLHQYSTFTVNRCKHARTLTPARAHQKKYAPPALYFSTSSSLSFLFFLSWRISTTNKNFSLITSPYNILNKRTDNQLTDIVEKLNAKWLSLSCECLPGGLPSRRVPQSRQLFEVFQSTWRYLLLFRRLHWHVEIALKYKIGRNTLGRLNDQKCFPASTVTKNFSYSLRSDYPTLQLVHPSRY